MKIEILFPESCNLFGDMGNMRYLRKCLPDAEFIETPLTGEPAFAAEDVSFIYLGPMTERAQEKVIKKLMPLKNRISELMESGTVFLFTGNAMEVLGQYIRNEDGTRIEGLGLLPIYAKRNMMKRHNSTFLGAFNGGEIMGFKSQFTMAYPCGEQVTGLFKKVKGTGLFKRCPYEGIRQNNFFGTYLIGPILLLNPDFTAYLMGLLGVKDPKPAFEEAARAAYEKRLKDFHEKG